MLVGINTSPDVENKKKSVVGFCASLDDNFAKFYSQTFLQNQGNVII
jgi:hypothetical protein